MTAFQFATVATAAQRADDEIIQINSGAAVHGLAGCRDGVGTVSTDDADFEMKGRYEFDCSLGIEGLRDGRLLSAEGRCDRDAGCSGSARIVVPDEKAGLRIVEPRR